MCKVRLRGSEMHFKTIFALFLALSWYEIVFCLLYLIVAFCLTTVFLTCCWRAALWICLWFMWALHSTICMKQVGIRVVMVILITVWSTEKLNTIQGLNVSPVLSQKIKIISRIYRPGWSNFRCKVWACVHLWFGVSVGVLVMLAMFCPVPQTQSFIKCTGTNTVAHSYILIECVPIKHAEVY